MRRFILLEHTSAPDDPAGRHYDLLLEETDNCRTWRLADIPRVGGAAVASTPLAPHRLAWLEHLDGPVSGNRGHARRVDLGTYAVEENANLISPEDCTVVMYGRQLRGVLVIEGSLARLQPQPTVPGAGQ